jgi:hypothetical protein
MKHRIYSYTKVVRKVFNHIVCRMPVQYELFLQEGIPEFKIPTNLENVSDISFQSGNALSLTGLQVTKNCYAIWKMLQKINWNGISRCKQKISVPISSPWERPRH